MVGKIRPDPSGSLPQTDALPSCPSACNRLVSLDPDRINQDVVPMKKAEPEIDKMENADEPLVPVEPATVTPEQLEELKARAAKADEHWERLLRTSADFDNFKKRVVREKQDAIRYANETLIEKLLPVLDNLEMALAAAQPESTESAQSLQAGVAMTAQQLKKVLADAGLEEVDAAGQKFDPNWHEAVSQLESADVPEGHVLQQLRKGYKLRDRLLRPASVVVAKKPAA
jgi:molecular chaperone GrpE